MNSKTIILQSQTNNAAGRAILTLTKENDLLQSKLRLYSFSPLDAGSKLGVFHNNQVYASNMLFKNGAYISSLVGDFDMDGDFYCAIIDTQNNNTPLLAGGTYGGYYFNDTSVITKNLNNNFSPNKIEPAACETAAAENEPPHASQPQYETTHPCAGCKYKEYFFQATGSPKNDDLPNKNAENLNKNAKNMQKEQLFEENEKNFSDLSASQQDCSANKANQQLAEIEAKTASQQQEQNDTPAPTPSIAESLIPQFDYIFKTYPACDELNSRIENSRFVTIAQGISTYCLGAIYNADQLKYICYAVPTAYNAPVPPELGKHHQWLPLDPADPLSDGYHIVFQDANDLKIIEF